MDKDLTRGKGKFYTETTMKEYLLLVVAGLFIASYVLNMFAGPVKLNLTSPVQFLNPNIISRYPFTAVEIFVRALALAMGIVVFLSFIEKKYFPKMATCIILGGLGVLYAIQQLANQGKITPLQWTLAFAGAGVMLVPPIIYYLVRGIIEGIYTGLTKNKTSSPPPQTTTESGENSEVKKKFWGE